MSKPTVFISYSHKDEDWKDKLLPHLKMLEQQGRLVVWDDRRIDAGESWYPEIREAMERAAVAVCLISANFLASDFCVKEEVPFLLGRREREGMVLIPVLVDTCAFELIDWLAPLQMLPRDGKSVASDCSTSPAVVFADVARQVHNSLYPIEFDTGVGSILLWLGKFFLRPRLPGAFPDPFPYPIRRVSKSQTEPRWPPLEEDRIEIDLLPQTGFELFGRQKELQMLDEAWESVQTNVINLVAYGGVGKTTLVKKWLERIAADNYRGAERAYAWSFYSQGTNEQATSADFFFNKALQWFGEEDPARLSVWEKGERLAELIQRQKTLLILDGLEPLQSGLDFDRGEIKDPALEMLIARLALQNDGLCVITTRQRITGWHADSLVQIDLEQISPQAARALLRVRGIRGSDQELEEASRQFGPHALAINLLAAYLHDIPEHPISAAYEIPSLDMFEEEGRHPRRMIAAFERRLGKGAALELLRVLGLFDRRAKLEEIQAVRSGPPVPELTEHLHKLTDAQWGKTVELLRQDGLIACKSRHRLENLDAHPIVKKHMAEELRKSFGDSWKEGHRRLYQHLKQSAREFPDTLEEMIPLYQAIAHGCRAGLHQQAMDRVYWARVCRGGQFFTLKKLGAFGADLAAVSNFFERRWNRPSGNLSNKFQAFSLNQAGILQRALGRLSEAEQPMRAALEVRKSMEDWRNAALVAANLSELHLALGDLPQALNDARHSVELADRSGDAFVRLANRTALADALHQAGNFDQSRSLFQEAEGIQKEDQPQNPLLFSLQGFQYCDLLLGEWESPTWNSQASSSYHQALSRCRQVRERATQTLVVAKKKQMSLLTFALDHLTLGRTYLLEAALDATSPDVINAAQRHLDRAVTGLHQANDQTYQPLGFIARAQIHRFQLQHTGDESFTRKAQQDLDEASQIASRGPMPLFQADIALEQARLHHAQGHLDQARQSLSKARSLIQKHAYHRRDPELKGLEELLKG